MRSRSGRSLLGPGMWFVALAVLATSCGNGASAAGGSSDLSVRITTPADGASVSQPFTVRLDASVPLGDPDTGEHHVHLCFDGDSCDSEYTLVYGNSIPVSGLTPGQHTIEASLRNADHSEADAPTDSITVMVTGGSSPSAGSDNGGSNNGGSRGSGYGY